MGAQIAISYPESLALSLKMGGLEFKNEMKALSLIKLYELGKVSSGIAAGLLDMTRTEFLELLGRYEVSYFQTGNEDDLLSDLNNA
jgi:predicted HTH domain antitoxin